MKVYVVVFYDSYGYYRPDRNGAFSSREKAEEAVERIKLMLNLPERGEGYLEIDEYEIDKEYYNEQ